MSIRSRTSSHNSDRWSKASSDSEASLFIGQSEIQLAPYRAVDVKGLLENVAQITGGRDKQGYLVITIFKDGVQDDICSDSLKKVIIYLTSTRSDDEKKYGFSFLICLNTCSPYGNVKPLTKILQDYFPYRVSQVFVLKPDGYREKHLSINSHKYNFEVLYVTRETIFKYISREELTEEFSGSIDFDFSSWFNMRLAFEKFLFESMALSTKLEEIKRSLLQDDFAITVDGVRDQLHHHQHVRKWIVKAPIELLDEEARKVINIIKTSCQCDDEDELKDEYRNSMDQVRSMIGTLKDQRSMLKELWVSRKGQLEQRFQFNLFKQDAEKMLQWIRENRHEFLIDFTEIGDDLEVAEELREEHKQFEENCGDIQVKIDRIVQVANRLRETQFFDVELIDRITIKLETEWKKLYTAVERRSTMLDASVFFHRSSEKYLEQSKAWMEELSAMENQVISTQEIHDSLLNSVQEIKLSMTESYEVVNTESKVLLNALQKLPTNDSREEKAKSRLSDYTEAASHVMDLIVIMYEQDKQSKILWEKTKLRITQKYNLYRFQQECDELLKYFRGHGHSFLTKNPWVGDQLEVAEELLGHQDEFEKSFQETFLKAKKLLESANNLAESKECDPQEIRLIAGQLETETKTFTTKLKKRREMLKMAVSFFRNAQKLSISIDKLKEEINLESGGTVEPKDFDEQLDHHRRECEITLEKILTTVHEGEKLSEELLNESKANGKESKSAWFLSGSNSAEQSRLAVELYLKELRHSQQQLEKLWRGRQQKLDYWVKVKHYERDANTLNNDVKKWNATWQKKELANDVNRALHMVERFENEYKDISERFFNLLKYGRELENNLLNSRIEVTITISDDAKKDGASYTADVSKKLQLEYDVVKKIHHKLKVKYEFSIKLRKLEADAKKVSSWIRHGESILAASQAAGYSMYEAEALLREYERFHVAIETTRLGVSDICKNAKKLVQDGHPDRISIENISEDVDLKWEQLMVKAKERREVVFSSYNFYRSAENVTKLLEKFSKDCKSEEDPCQQFNDYELKAKLKKLEALIKKSEPERKAVEDGCQKVKECSEEFLKKILPEGEGDTKIEISVGDVVEHVTSQETYVLKQIQLRKTVVAGCVEFVNFQQQVNETLKLITDQGLILSEGLLKLKEQSEDDSEQDENEKEDCLHKQEEYKVMFLDIREKVKVLLKEASELVKKIHFHRVNIGELATSIDLRYKDLAQHMKQFRDCLEAKLGCTIPEFEEEGEWPSLSALHLPSSDMVTRRDVSNDSGIHEMTEEKRRSLKRIEFIIKELIQTEQAYVADLECCIENFSQPSYNNPDFPEALKGKQETIFGNIDLIYKFHSTIFLAELEKYEKCAEQVGKCFTEWQDQFMMYVHYCANKPESNSLLIEHGENFFEDLQQKQGLGLSLAAYLIKPVQRITKYQLLLKDLLTCCEDADGSLEIMSEKRPGKAMWHSRKHSFADLRSLKMFGRKAGLEVMLSVPRRANDAMYLCMITGFFDGNLETLGKILLQDSFQVWDPKHILKKGKDRHVFLFEQALLFCKEIKDGSGKCTYAYKSKLKTSELGLTEHIAEDRCKFAVWTGEPPFTEEKRVIKAESESVKQMWVKEIRHLTQEFQFGVLNPRPSFYPTSPRKKNKKTTSAADVSLNNSDACSVVNGDRLSVDFDATSRASIDNFSTRNDVYLTCENYTAKGENEISLTKGQNVEVLSKPPGSRSWRVRVLDEIIGGDREGFVPHQVLRRLEDSPMRGKRNSVETLNSQSSEDSFNTDSPKGSMISVSGGRTSPKSRRRAKSVHIGSTLNRMGTWSRRSSKKMSGSLSRPPLPTTPTRSNKISGGGSKKLQALLGAPESDIDLLIRPSDGKYATLGRSPSTNAERIKFLANSNDIEDAGFQEGDYDDSDNDSISDASECNASLKEEIQEAAISKRKDVLRELIQTERDYINDLELIVLEYIQGMIKRTDIPEELKNKEKIIFGNLNQLLTFHKNTLIKELEKCENAPEKLPGVFMKLEKKFEMYIQYCANKPRSDLLIHDHLSSFFAELSDSITPKANVADLLMKPVQRIMKYHIMLKDFTKYSVKAGLDPKEFSKALNIMYIIPKKADDLMHIGLLEDFTENLNNQGKLIMQDTLFVGNAKTQTCSVERRVFLFEKILIFSEPLERKANLYYYIYTHHIKMDALGITSHYDDDPCKLAVWTKDKEGKAEIYVMIAKSSQVKKAWIEAIRNIIEKQYSQAHDELPHLTEDETRSLKLYQDKYKGVPASENNDGATASNHYVVENETADAAAMGKIAHSSQAVTGIPSLQHVKLIPLKELQGSEAEQEAYVVTENYLAQSPDELTVAKNEYVFLVNRAKKNATYYEVRLKDKTGRVPSKILKKTDLKVKRSSSFGNANDKQKKEKKRSKSVASATLLRTASLKRKKDKRKQNGASESPTKSVLQHWTKNVESSDDDETKQANLNASESLEKILKRDSKTKVEIAPEFKILPRDVTVDVACPVKLNCTVVAYPEPEITWTKNNTIELETNDKYNITCKSHLCTFEILSASKDDTGIYTVTAKNDNGSVSCSAKVTVRNESKVGVPSMPWVPSITATSVTLKWNPPIDVQTNPVKAYTIQYRENNESWHVAIAVCNDTTTTIDELTTNSSYEFRILANTETGLSDPSLPSDPIEIKESNSPPSQLQQIIWRENVEDHYDICGVLGRGRFSVVKRCVEKTTNNEFAAKIVRKKLLPKAIVESEVAILQSLNHPNIVKLHEIYDSPKALVVVEQLLTGGRLFDHVVMMDFLTEEIAIKYIKQLLEALQFLHAQSIAHLDVKPENILLSGSDDPCLILSDFGEAVRLSKAQYGYQQELIGNPEFAAPEIVSQDSVSLATDLWSVGVIVYVLLSGVSPFYSDDLDRACENVTEIRYRFPEDFFSEISEEAKDFIEELLIRDQTHRPDANECLNLQWVKSLETDKSNTSRQKRISLSRLAAFNARRQFQYEATSANTSNSFSSKDKKKPSPFR